MIFHYHPGLLLLNGTSAVSRSFWRLPSAVWWLWPTVSIKCQSRSMWLSHEYKKGIFLFGAPELHNYTQMNNLVTAKTPRSFNSPVQLFQILLHLDCVWITVIRSPAGCRNRSWLFIIPFMREHRPTGCDLPDDTAVSYKINDSARTAFDCWRAEFHLYCCHTYIYLIGNVSFSS